MSQQSGSQSISTENRDLDATLRVYPPDLVFPQTIASLGHIASVPAQFPPYSTGASSSSHVAFDVVLPATSQSGAYQYFGTSSSSPHGWTNSKSNTVMGSYDSPVPIGAAFPAVFACSSPPLVSEMAEPVESLTPPISSPKIFFPADASEYGSFPDSMLTKALSNLDLRAPMGVSASLPATPASTARSDAAFPGLARLPSAAETNSLDVLSSTGLESSSPRVHVLSSELSSDSCARRPAVAAEPAGTPHGEANAEDEDEAESEEAWESVEALFDLARNNVHASSGSSVALVQARVIPAQHKGVITALVHTIDAISFPEEPKSKVPSKKGKHGAVPTSVSDALFADSVGSGAAMQTARKRGSKADKAEKATASKAERQRAKKADRGGFKLPSAHALGIASSAPQGSYTTPTYHYAYSTAPTFYSQPQQPYQQPLQHQQQQQPQHLQQFAFAGAPPINYQRQQAFPQQGYQQHGLALQSPPSQSQQYLPAYAQSSLQMHMGAHSMHSVQSAPVSQPLQPLAAAPAYGQSPTPSFALASQASSDAFPHVYAHSHAHTYPMQQQQQQYHQPQQPQQQQQQQSLFAHPLHYPYANSPSQVSLAGSSPTPSLSSSHTSSAHFHLGPQPTTHAQPVASQTPFLSAMEPRAHSQALRHSLSLGQPHNAPLPHPRPLSAHQPLGTASARDHTLHNQQPTHSHGVFPSALFAHQPAGGTASGDYHGSGLSTDTAARSHTPTHRRFTSWSEAAQ